MDLVIYDKPNNDIELSELSNEGMLLKICEMLVRKDGMISSYFHVGPNYLERIKNKLLQAIPDELNQLRLAERYYLAENNIYIRLKYFDRIEQIRLEEKAVKKKFAFLIQKIHEYSDDLTVEFAFWRGQITRNPGVYLLFTEAEGLLYVGQAKNIKQRLKSKHHVYVKDEILIIQIYPIPDARQRLQMESALIKQCAPKRNILLRPKH